MGTKEKDKENRIVLLKLSLYCIALWILMFMLIVLKIDVSMIGAKASWQNIRQLLLPILFQ